MSVKGIVSIAHIHPETRMTGRGAEMVLHYEVYLTLYLRPEQLGILAGMKDHTSRIVATLEEEPL